MSDELREGQEAPPPGARTMAWVRWGLVAVMAVVATVSVAGYLRHAARSSSVHQPGQTLYHCPMHPQIVQDHPGECPICGMTLVPFSDEARSDASVNAAVPGLVPVTLSEERVQLIGLRSELSRKENLGDKLRTVGVVEATETGRAQVTARFAGWVESLAVSETGRTVKRGQVLATLYSPEVLQAQEEYLSALGWVGSDPAGAGEHIARRGQSAGLADDARRRLELLGVAPEELDTLARERKVKRALPLRSPVDGHVITKNVVLGMAVQPGVALFEVADLSTVWVVADVYEGDLARVATKQAVSFSTAVYPGETFGGKVDLVYPTMDVGTRTLRVRLVLRNRGGAGGLRLRPGMYGDVVIDLPSHPVVTIPAEALVDTGERRYVFIAQDGGRFEPRRIEPGPRIGDRVAVMSGVAEGERVVTTANFLLDSESRLRAAVQGQAPAKAGKGAP